VHPGLGRALGSSPLALWINRTLLHVRWDTRSSGPEPRSVDRPGTSTSGDARFILWPAPRPSGFTSFRPLQIVPAKGFADPICWTGPRIRTSEQPLPARRGSVEASPRDEASGDQHPSIAYRLVAAKTSESPAIAIVSIG
jgi:hypothetical protein